MTPTTGSGARDRLLERVRKATVGRFDILRLLGRGGMAAVYLAYDERLHRKVAVKVMLPQLELTDGMSDRFAQEARTAARLEHPNIIVVHDVIEIEDLVLLVMNLVNGASLEQVQRWLPATPEVAARRLPISAVRAVLLQVTSALEYAHGERVVHRDIKPSNIMITVRGDAIITDFGIAKVMADVSQTKSSVLMGTPTYMSPEQCQGHAVSGASDQYSLGVMAYEMLVGEPPFIGSSLEVQNAHVGREPTPLLSRRLDAPPEFAAAVMRMLAKRPTERFASMIAAGHALGIGFNALDPAPRRLLAAAASTAARAALSTEDTTIRGGPQTPGSPVPPPAPAGSASTIAVFTPDRVEVGDSFTVVASPQDSAGNSVPGVTVTLTSQNPDIATVDATRGTVMALAPGRAKLVAIGGGARGEAVVSVIPKRAEKPNVQYPAARVGSSVRPVASLRINPLPRTVNIGDAMQLVATALDEGGNELDGRVVSWTSSAPTVARVSPRGMVRVLGPGTVQFTCVCEGKSASAQLGITSALGPSGNVIAGAGVGQVSAERGAPAASVHRAQGREAMSADSRPSDDLRPTPRVQPITKTGSRTVIAATVGVIVLIAVVAFYVFGPTKKPIVPTVAVEPFFSRSALDALASGGYAFADDRVTEDFSDARKSGGGEIRNGRLVRMGDGTVFRLGTWHVPAGDLAVHFEIQYEGGDAPEGAGLYLGGVDPQGANSSYFLLLFHGTPKFTYSLTHVANEALEPLVRPTTIPLVRGSNRIDLIVIGAKIGIYINDKFIVTTPPLPSALDGQFGLYVPPAAHYSFDNIVVAALLRN